MVSVEQDLADIRARLQRAQSARAKAEYQHEQATQRLKDAKLALMNEFGVQQNEDIKLLLQRLNDEYIAELRDIERELESAGG